MAKKKKEDPLDKKLRAMTERFIIELQKSLVSVIEEEDTMDCSSMICRGKLNNGEEFQIHLKVTVNEMDFLKPGYGEIDLSPNDVLVCNDGQG